MSRIIRDKPLIYLELWTSDTPVQLAENRKDVLNLARSRCTLELVPAVSQFHIILVPRGSLFNNVKGGEA